MERLRVEGHGMLAEAAAAGFVSVGLRSTNLSGLSGLVGTEGSGRQREAEVAERPLLQPPWCL